MVRDEPRRRTLDTRPRPKLRPIVPDLEAEDHSIFSLFPAFLHGLSAMAAMTQALQIASVSEQCPAALVIHDVIHVGCVGSESLSGTFPTERLLKQLIRTEIIHPDGLTVPAVP